MIKIFNIFIKENVNNFLIEDYLTQVYTGEYNELTEELFDIISMEGWLVSIEEEFGEEYFQDDFEFITLNLSSTDKNGLINSDENIIEKFNDFDMRLKSNQEYPYDTLDFIDYDKGIVYIIRLL